MLDTASKSLKYTSTAIRGHAISLDLVLRLSATLLIPTITLFTTEWIHRGTLTGFFDVLVRHFPSFFLGWAFLLLCFMAVSRLTGWYPLAAVVVGVVGNLPAAVTFFKLQLRNEPFLPWDISQAAEAFGVMEQANLKIQSSMLWTLSIFILLVTGCTFIKVQKRKDVARAFWRRIAVGAGAVAGLCVLIFGIYLQPTVTAAFGIVPDMWMQNRFYRNYGVITGFMTNLQQLDIAKPDGYNAQTIATLQQQTNGNMPETPLFAGSYAAQTDAPEQQPNVIYIMGEAFVDVTELPGITFDQEVTPTLNRLRETGAVGKAYSPSFGGGTCDVEFEALTGFSVEHLPAGSKPYQQHVTRQMQAFPSLLKERGYETMAIHGYYRKYWSRDQAYPNLGIDTFIAAEDFPNPERKRGAEWKGGLISDNEMANRIIAEYEAQQSKSDQPLFVHAVTMQNHSGYSPKNYPESELVQVTGAPDDLSPETIAQLRDFATGIRETDAMLGRLIDYFNEQDEPTIIVFWGDHFNNVGKGYELYEKTGFIEKGDTKSPNLQGTPLAIWSNYYQEPVDLGTVATYNITPVMNELYGLPQSTLYEHLIQQFSAYRARTRGVTVQPDGSTAQQLTAEQEQWFQKHWLLQYDLMFGESYQTKQS